MNRQSGFYDRIGMTMRKIQHFPAFLMFIVVLAAASLLNYNAMNPTVGPIAAIIIAGFFGLGVLAWHIVENRTDDSRYQEDVAKTAKWINAALDAALLVINLFRAETHSTIAGISTWDAAAYLMIGLSAITHVICFLLWSQADPRKSLQKKSERDLNEIAILRQASQNSIESAEAELAAIKYATDEEIRLRTEYKSLPTEQVDAIVAKMRAAAHYTVRPKKAKSSNYITNLPAPILTTQVDQSEREYAETFPAYSDNGHK